MEAILSLVLYMGFIFGLMWLIVVRPQKKRDRAVSEMQNSIKLGDNVVLNSGMYGKVVDIVNDLFVLEVGLNKTVLIPVKKEVVMGVATPNLSVAKNTNKEVIVDEAGKMNQLVKNLLELNQLEFGNEDRILEPFDIVALIYGVAHSLEILVEQKDVHLILPAQEEVMILGDQFKIEQVIRNYLTNAFNHVSGDNVIQIKIQQGEKARISVFNTGTPIPEEDVDRIWEKFYKVDKARTREYGGNGIGLSLVKATMESMHQGYGVKNYDNGVEFWFELDRK